MGLRLCMGLLLCSPSVVHEASERAPHVAASRRLVASQSSTEDLVLSRCCVDAAAAASAPALRAAAIRSIIPSTVSPMPLAMPRSTTAWRRRSSAEGRALGFLCKQRSTRSWSGADHFFRSASIGGGLDVMRKSARIVGFTFECGGEPSAISMRVMPNDQMSVGVPYAPDSMSSGDIHRGVPMTVERFV